jgi:RNA polymerase-binding transcription factor DksA
MSADSLDAFGAAANIDSGAARSRLEAERERVTALVSELRGELGNEDEHEQMGELSGYDQHPADAGTETFEREKDLSILEQLEAELAELEAALHRIDEGSYGVDEETGEPIDPERLDAMPAARTNVHPSEPDRR